MLRGVFAIVLLVACFPEDSTAGSDDGSPVPGFSFVGTGTPRVAMSAPSGLLFYEGRIRNTTAWQPTFSNGSLSISQMIALPDLMVLYRDVTAIVDLLRKIGPVTASLGSSRFKATLTATDDSSNNSSCLLNILIEVQSLGVDLELQELGLVGALNQAILSALAGIVTTLEEALREILPKILTNVITDVLDNRFGLDALCRTLAASNFTTYPDPLI